MCGLLVAGIVTTAWLLVGRPVPAQGAMWFQVAKVGTAQVTGGPQQPFFALVLGTGARSDDPSQSPDDPGLADAIHVIGVNPALKSATLIDIPRDTEGPGGDKLNSYIVNNPGGNDLRAEADAVSSVVERAHHLGDPRQLPELPADGRRDRRDRRQHPDGDERRLLRRALRRRACAPERRAGTASSPATGTRSTTVTSPARATRGC